MTASGKEGVLVHRQYPHLFTHIDYSLKPEGILEEEYTSEVLTHSKLLPYEDVWDGYFDRRIPWIWWVLAGSGALGAPCVGLFGLPVAAAALGALTVACLAGVAALGWHCTYTAFDYEGHWVVTFEGRDTEAFRRFLETFHEKVQERRFSLQKHLEGLPLGEVSISGFLTRWTCRFRYDRITVERSGPWRYRRLRYHSLSMLRAPVRLEWRPSWAGLLTAALAGAALGLVAWRHPEILGRVWAVAAAGFLFGFSLWTFLARAAVSSPAGEGVVRSPAFPILRRGRMQGILLWFSRLANLSDRLEDVRSEDYWEYHREKVDVLRAQGFLEEWPYRSALGKINSQERENLAPEP